MEQDILLKSSYDDKTKFNMNIIDYKNYQIYLDYLDYYLPIKNKDWLNFSCSIFALIQKIQSHAKVMIAEHDIPNTLQQARERFADGTQETMRIHALQEKNEFSEKLSEDNFKNEMSYFSMTNKAFLAVVRLLHLLESILKFFLLNPMFGNSLSKYIYCEKKIDNEINKILAKQKNNYDQEFDEDSSVICLGKLSSSIGFKPLLKLIDEEKYKIDTCPFLDDIMECNDFCNYLKHQLDSTEKKNLRKRKIFYSADKNFGINSFCAELFSLEVFFRYIIAFEDFWMYIFKNSVKPEDKDEFTDTMIREQVNIFIERNKKFPWHQK